MEQRKEDLFLNPSLLELRMIQVPRVTYSSHLDDSKRTRSFSVTAVLNLHGAFLLPVFWPFTHFYERAFSLLGPYDLCAFFTIPFAFTTVTSNFKLLSRQFAAFRYFRSIFLDSRNTFPLQAL